MNSRRQKFNVFLMLLLLLSTLITPVLQPNTVTAHNGDHSSDSSHRLLVVTHTEGYFHGSINDIRDVMPQWGQENGFEVVFADSSSSARGSDVPIEEAFTPEFLADFDAMMFANTTGNFGTTEERQAIMDFIESGGGFVGAHAAIDTGYDWPEYGEMVGTYFQSHPWVQQVNYLVEDSDHPATRHLQSGEWTKLEEVYIFPEDLNPRDAGKHILLSLDTDSVSGNRGGQFDDHPAAWCSPQEEGRVFITALGHHSQTWSSEPDFKQHILGGLEYAFGIENDTDCHLPSPKPGLVKEQLTNAVPRPTALEVTDDSRVFSISINGGVYETQPNGSTNRILNIPTTTEGEHGVMGIALDPEFDENGHVFIYYSEPEHTSEGEIINNLSRFTYENGEIDPATEELLLEVPSDPQCCHQGGYLKFGPDGKLYLSTGDNKPATNGPNALAIETAQNLGDLRGSILRINKDGSIPEDNPFVDVDGARGEIYAYGFRNPYRFTFDEETGFIYVGDVGPDSSSDYDEYNVITEPGQNFGWPYIIGDTPYVNYLSRFESFANNFDFSTVRGNFTADDVLTTAEEILHFHENEAVDPIAFYPYGHKDPWGSGGRTSNVGPVYDPGNGENAFPATHHGKLLFYDFVRGWMKLVDTDENGEIIAVEDFIDGLLLPMDVDIGPDGSIYIAEFGSSWWEVNDQSGITKISWGVLERAPVIQVNVSKNYAFIGDEISFDSSGTYDPDGNDITFDWDFGDGTTSTEASPTHAYSENGEYTVRLSVTDATGKVASWNTTIVIGNTPPVVEILQPSNNTFFRNGDTFTFVGRAYDAEDGEIACENLEWRLDLLHDDHGHPQEYKRGCEVTYTLQDDGHNYTDNIWWQMSLVARDSGGDGAPVLEGIDTIEFIKNRIEAEHYDDKSPAINTEGTSDVGGGQNIGWTGPGEWLKFEDLNLEQMDTVYLRTASLSNYHIELRLDSPDGESIASIEGNATGGWQNWNTVSAELSDVEGNHDIYVYYVSGEANINWIQFGGEGFPGPGEEGDPYEPVDPGDPGDPSDPGEDCGGNYCFEPIADLENSLDRSNWIPSASHSHEEEANDAPSGLHYAIDDDLGTRWSSGEDMTDGMYYQVDFGEVHTINAVYVDSGSHWEERGLKDSHRDWFLGYRIEISVDGENWTTVAEQEENDQYIIHVQFDDVDARFVKVTNTKDITVPGWLSIHDLQVIEAVGDSEPGVDVTELENLISTAKSYTNDEGEYTEESFEALQIAIAEAEAALETIETIQDLNNAFAALQEKINALQPSLSDPVLDVSELENLIESAKAISNEDEVYTDESYETLQAAIAEAEAQLEVIETEEELMNAISALLAAVEGLVERQPDPVLDVSELENLIESAKAISNEDEVYTDESYETLQAAIAEAEAQLEVIQTEAELVNALVALQAAIDGLVEKQVDPDPKPDRDKDKDSDKDKDKDTDIDKDTDHKDIEEKNGDSDDELPSTATSMYNYLFIGFFILIIGCSLYFLSKKGKRQEVNR
ncbi:ThuA domain-containing protein [Evansella cellulosilytica]|uniref:LPXTG-motif cell wall anchor domain protein n=1 Tax=Evansella cellulosilytica (strain ATCC 21833 / DSM 2522 / FERM P-1141 / JCM 9156 / N-4) TaxID=649639 RepID=E6TT63_EVAC2|nr:ThuA domain-containing protein [Evansella cellulosilytica]ADU31971.1 LPXTG-motif cell wall anchor domain protein [Evansella cellulosilytica DSM 2522]